MFYCQKWNATSDPCLIQCDHCFDVELKTIDMKVKTWLNASEFPKWGEVLDPVSLTVPDQTMSIQEIMSRYTRGLPIGGAKSMLFQEEGDDDMPDMRTMDLSEQHDFIIQAKKELSEIASNEAKRKAENEAKKRQERADWLAYRELLKKQQATPPAKADGTNPT